MRLVESVFVAKYFYIFPSKIALIKLNNQFIQIIIREIRVSEFADCYLNARLLFFCFFVFSFVQFLLSVFAVRISAQEDKASSGDQDCK